MLDLEVLLAAVSPDAPCGPDLEYDPEFVALEQDALGTPERQVGDKVVKAEDPNWGEIVRRAEALLARSKDIRVAVLYGRALTRTEDLPGLSVALTLIRRLLEQYWEEVHPRIDPADQGDPNMRSSALASLTITPSGVMGAWLQDVRRAFIVRPGPYGKVSVRDVLLLQGKPTPGPDLRSQAEIETIIREAGAHKLVFVSEAKAAREEVGKIQSLLKNDRSGKAVAKDDTSTESAPDLDPLAQMLTSVVQFCDRLVSPADESGAGDQQVTGDQPGSGTTPAGSKSIDVIRSREDAARLLDKVCEFIERTEPSNPAPLFIRRAQKLMV